MIIKEVPYKKKYQEILTLVADPSGFEPDEFKSILKSNADILVDFVGEMHGPSALAVFKEEVASYLLKDDPLTGEYVGIWLYATRPSHISRDEFISELAKMWSLSPICSTEIYAF